MTREDVIKLASEAGSKAACNYNAEQKNVAQSGQQLHKDARLHNAKLLLRKYRSFREVAEEAQLFIQECENPRQEYEYLMMPTMEPADRDARNRRAAARTITIFKHMHLMMQLYENYCYSLQSKEGLRRWRVVNELYIRDLAENEQSKTVASLAEDEGVSIKTIYKDIDIACERIAALMFGIDALY